MNNDLVTKFWTWFGSISKELLKNPHREDLISQLDNHVNDLGHLAWEIGPLKENTYYLAISPNLSDSKMELTRSIISTAPLCDGWTFLYAKPIKVQWKGIWKMKNHVGKEILVDCNNWEYILYEFKDRTFDMDILIDGVDGDMETCYSAIDIALTSYLGEEEFMKLIKGIKILTELDDELMNKLTKLKFIRKHIESLNA